MSFSNTIMQVPDIIETKEVMDNLIPVENNSKVCIQPNWNNPGKKWDVTELSEKNSGLRLPKGGLVFNINERKFVLFVTDIDGSYSDRDKKNNNDYDKLYRRKITKEPTFKEFKNDCFCVDTANGGGHIYALIDITDDIPFPQRHELSKRFKYPLMLNKENAGVPLDHDIEFFWENRYMVFIGSEINGQFYKITDGGINKFSDLKPMTYDEFEDRFINALVDAGFEYTESEIQDVANKHDISFVPPSNKQMLTAWDIENLGNLFIPVFKANDGGKYYFTLALSSHLANFIPKESVSALGEYIIRQEPNLFNDDAHFLKTLLSGFDNDAERQTGGKTCYEQYAKKVYPNSQEWWIKLIYWTFGNVELFPVGKTGTSYYGIELNRREHIIQVNYYGVSRKGKEYRKSSEPVLGFEIKQVRRIENPVIPNAPSYYELQYIPTGTNKVITITGETMKEIEEQIKQQVGVVLSGKWKQIFNQIIVHFSKINFLSTDSSCSIPGIFKLDGEIRRFNFDNEEVSKGFDLYKLINAVSLLNEIKDAFPTKPEKLGHLCRIALLFPFYHILKEQGHLMKYLFLGGAGGSLKSTTAEMLLSFYNPVVKVGKKANVYSAGSFSSPYQVGLKFGISSYGFVVNEPATALNSEDIGEILKSSIETDVSRSTHDATYYSYSSAIFASNTDIKQDDATIRRYNVFYYQNSERAGEAHLKVIANLLNDKKINDRFNELQAIGDFVFTYIANNPNTLNEMSVEELELYMVSKLEEITEIDLDWMKLEGKEESYIDVIQETDASVLADFVQYVAECYNKVFVTYKMNTTEQGTFKQPALFDKDGIITLASRGLCPLIGYKSKGNKIIIKGTEIKKFYSKQFAQLVSTNRFFEELSDFAEVYDVKIGRFYVQGKQHRGILLEPELLVDLLNDDLREGAYDEDNDTE